MIPYYNTGIRNLSFRLRKFRDSLDEILEDIVREKEDIIISAVTNDQLFMQGITGKGVEIWSYKPYTENTVWRKVKKGRPYDRVTLRDTGAFYKSIYLIYDSGGFYLHSNDRKVNWLREKYGDEIFRLTDENLTKILHEHIRPELEKRLKEYLK